MAKNSQVLRDKKRDKLIAKYADRRAALRKQLKDISLDIEEKFAISAALTKLPTNSCPTRKTRRCMLTGRSPHPARSCSSTAPPETSGSPTAP